MKWRTRRSKGGLTSSSEAGGIGVLEKASDLWRILRDGADAPPQDEVGFVYSAASG
jgi:hypothetical protein